MTDGRLAFSIAAATALTMLGGNAIMDAVAAQNFMNPRRLTPCARRTSPTVLLAAMLCSSALPRR